MANSNKENVPAKRANKAQKDRLTDVITSNPVMLNGNYITFILLKRSCILLINMLYVRSLQISW